MRPTVPILALVTIAALAGCRESPLQNPSSSGSVVLATVPDSPQELLVGVLEELDRISNGLPAGRLYGGGQTLQLAKGSAETTYVYGEVTPDGYGAVVTRRHTTPKGIPLITIRKTYGMEGNVIVSQLDRYVSQADFEAGRPEQSVRTEVVGLSADTILTRIVRNNQLETHTFRLPVVTVSLKSVPELSRTVSRYALGGGTRRRDTRRKRHVHTTTSELDTGGWKPDHAHGVRGRKLAPEPYGRVFRRDHSA